MTAAEFDYKNKSVFKMKTFYLDLVCHLYFWGVSFFLLVPKTGGVILGVAVSLFTCILMKKWWVRRLGKNTKKLSHNIKETIKSNDFKVGQKIWNDLYVNDSIYKAILTYFMFIGLFLFTSNICVDNRPELLNVVFSKYDGVLSFANSVYPFFETYVEYIRADDVYQYSIESADAFDRAKGLLYVGITLLILRDYSLLIWSFSKIRCEIQKLGGIGSSLLTKLSDDKKKRAVVLISIILTLLFIGFSYGAFDFARTNKEFELMHNRSSSTSKGSDIAFALSISVTLAMINYAIAEIWMARILRRLALK